MQLKIKMRFKIKRNFLIYVLFGMLLLLYSCGFTELQNYQLRYLQISTGILVFQFLCINKLKTQKQNLLILFFAFYVLLGMIMWGAEKEKSYFILYATMLLSGVLYVANDISIDMTEKFFRILQFVALFEAITIFLSVAIPGLMLQKFGFLYRQLVIEIIAKELSRGIYSGYIAEKAAAAYLLNLGLAYTSSHMSVDGKIDKCKLAESAILLFAIFFTGKRVLLLTAALMFVVSLLSGQPLEKKIKAFMIIIASVIATFLFIQLVPAARITFDRFMNSESYESMNGRGDMWNSAIKIYKENIIFGCGYGSYQKISGIPFNAHNSYLQLLAETGIVGFVMLGGIILETLFRAFINLHKHKSAMNYLAVNLLLLSIVYSFTGNVFHTANQLITFFIAVSIVNSRQNNNGVKASDKI